MKFSPDNNIKCPNCGVAGMNLSPQHDSGWCDTCRERSVLPPPKVVVAPDFGMRNDQLNFCIHLLLAGFCQTCSQGGDRALP
jgi:hypothetical protein